MSPVMRVSQIHTQPKGRHTETERKEDSVTRKEEGKHSISGLKEREEDFVRLTSDKNCTGLFLSLS